MAVPLLVGPLVNPIAQGPLPLVQAGLKAPVGARLNALRYDEVLRNDGFTAALFKIGNLSTTATPISRDTMPTAILGPLRVLSWSKRQRRGIEGTQELA